MFEIILEFSIIILLFNVLVVIFMFTAKRVNMLIKNKFVDGLKEYDYLLENRENELNNLNEIIEEKKLELKEVEKKIEENDSISLSTEKKNENNNLNVLNDLLIEEENIDTVYKQIKSSFSFDYTEIIKQFIKSNVDNNDISNELKNIRDKFSNKIIYKINCVDGELQKEIIKNILSDDEINLLDYDFDNSKFNILNFINFLEYKIIKESNDIEIVVGYQDIDYSYIDERITMIYDNNITEGIKICYHNKVYDFSI